MRTYIVFLMLLVIKAFSKAFYFHKVEWIGDPPPDRWENHRIVAFLHHTSLYEPLFAGIPPRSFLWRLARHGVIPAADKTINRPFVGKLFKFVAHQVVSISRQRDHTWFEVLRKIDPDSMVIILPEGRMMRANGLDSQGNPMTVRGGIADILDAVREGRMLIAYSGGLHHVQVPGQRFPKIFRKIRLRLELIQIEDYLREMNAPDLESLKKAVKEDLERRRELYCYN